MNRAAEGPELRPSKWTRIDTGWGQPSYYVNDETNETTWTLPQGSHAKPPDGAPPPPPPPRPIIPAIIIIGALALAGGAAALALCRVAEDAAAWSLSVAVASASSAVGRAASAVKTLPKRARARRLFNSSVQYQLERQYGAAERCLRRVLMLDPLFALAHCNLGNVLNDVRRNYAGAEWHYNVAIALDRRCAFAHYNLAALLARRRGDLEGAEERLREAVAIEPNFCSAYCNLGLVVQRTRGREREAETCFRHALTINPHDADTHVHVGIVLYREFENMVQYRSATTALARSKRDTALVCFDRALELDPSSRHAAQWSQLLTSQRADEALVAAASLLASASTL